VSYKTFINIYIYNIVSKFLSCYLFFLRYSERSNTKCVGITIETRPDYCLKRHLSDMLAYGCTRLEIGVQSVYEDVARDTNRSELAAFNMKDFKWRSRRVKISVRYLVKLDHGMLIHITSVLRLILFQQFLSHVGNCSLLA